MKKLYYIFASVFMLSSMIWMDSYAAQIQEPAETVEAVPEEAEEVETEKPEYEETTYVKSVFFDETVLQGIYADSDLFFYVPEYWDTRYVYAQIEYRISQLIQNVASSLTITVNGIPVESYKLEYGDGEEQIMYVEIPVSLLKTGYNSLSLGAYARLYDEEGCMDDFSNANWLSLSKNSYVQCGYELKEHDHMISYFPYPFISTVEETGRGLTIAVSDQASDGEMAAAMYLMADLSTKIKGENDLRLALYSDIAKTETDRTILIAEAANLPQDYREKLKAENIVLSEKEAVIYFTEDERDCPLLLISSENGDCLTEAVYMLMDEDRVTQEKGNVAVVGAESSLLITRGNETEEEKEDTYTIEELNGGGISFTGPFHKEKLVYLPFAEQVSVDNASSVSLQFRYSENLDFKRALVTVYWGDIPIASKKLEKDKAEGDELLFTIPGDAGRTKAGAIKIAFDLEIPDLVCTGRQEQMPWAYVLGESSLYLPLRDKTGLSFEHMPAPFVKNGIPEKIMLVVSENPTTEELDRYGHILGMYAEEIKPYGDLKVKRCSEFSKEDGDYHIITAGTYEKNSLIRELNPYFAFPYSSDGTKFESNQKLILSDKYASDMAVIELIPSPYGENRGILTVMGTTDKTLSYADTLIKGEEAVNLLTGDCVIVDSQYQTKAYQMIADSAQEKAPTLTESLKENKQSLLFTLAATSVMLMLLVAVIIILVRIKAYYKK